MNIRIEYEKEILKLKLDGLFVGKKILDFENEVIPIILGLNSRYVIVDFNDVDACDNLCAKSIIKISTLISRFDGKVVLYGLNNETYISLRENDVFDYCFKARDYKNSLEVIKI